MEYQLVVVVVVVGYVLRMWWVAASVLHWLHPEPFKKWRIKKISYGIQEKFRIKGEKS